LSHVKRGVHPEKYLQKPSIELFEHFQQAARGHIRLLTIAPELGGATELIAYATSLGVRCSLGHTNALASETRVAIDAGANSATHTFNTMRALGHREPGVLGVVLDDQRLYSELICDGVHVAPELVRLWLKSKGPERGILVTDAMSAVGMPDGRYKLGELDVDVRDGRAMVAADLERGVHTLAGSVLTMDRAVANLRQFTGASIAEATRLASHNPAAMLGWPELTRLAPGGPANLNRFDASGRLVASYIQGELVT
jgi:N-acetylglucosamine-6-phosphate deacetylase